MAKCCFTEQELYTEWTKSRRAFVQSAFQRVGLDCHEKGIRKIYLYITHTDDYFIVLYRTAIRRLNRNGIAYQP